MATCAFLDPPRRGAGLRPSSAPGLFGPRCGRERTGSDARRRLDLPYEHLGWRSILSRRRRDADDEGWRAGVGRGDDVQCGSIYPLRYGYGEWDGRDPARPDARLRKLGPLGERTPRIRRSQGDLERPRPRGLGNPAYRARGDPVPAERPEHDDLPTPRRRVALPARDREFKSGGKANELLGGLPLLLRTPIDAVAHARKPVVERDVHPRGASRGRYPRGPLRHVSDPRGRPGWDVRPVLLRARDRERCTDRGVQRHDPGRDQRTHVVSIPGSRAGAVLRSHRDRLGDHRVRRRRRRGWCGCRPVASSPSAIWTTGIGAEPAADVIISGRRGPSVGPPGGQSPYGATSWVGTGRRCGRGESHPPS